MEVFLPIGRSRIWNGRITLVHCHISLQTKKVTDSLSVDHLKPPKNKICIGHLTSGGGLLAWKTLGTYGADNWLGNMLQMTLKVLEESTTSADKRDSCWVPSYWKPKCFLFCRGWIPCCIQFLKTDADVTCFFLKEQIDSNNSSVWKSLPLSLFRNHA